MKVWRAVFFGLWAVGCLVPADLGAQQYPTQAIRLVITHSPGGVNDLAGRLIQPYPQKYLGTPVVIDNMPGVGGNVVRSFASSQS